MAERNVWPDEEGVEVEGDGDQGEKVLRRWVRGVKVRWQAVFFVVF